ncbi:hypothetical protein GCM10027176_30500 [Actinoallomurus bryophytorum]
MKSFTWASVLARFSGGQASTSAYGANPIRGPGGAAGGVEAPESRGVGEGDGVLSPAWGRVADPPSIVA